MGICSDSCECLVDGDRGILVTGTGDADTPYIVSPDVKRDLTLWVTTRSELPTLTVAETGTLAFAEDSGILWHWNGIGWRSQGAEWYRADFGGLVVDVVNTDSPGFVVAGAASFAIWAKGWFDVTVPAGTVWAPLYANLKRTDSGALLDSCQVSVSNFDVADQPVQVPFSLMATIGLGDPLDVTGIVVGYVRDAATASATLENGRIFAQTITIADTTTAFP